MTDTIAKKAYSIDDFFSSSFDKKKAALQLIKENDKLSEEQLESVAEAIYETTFAKIFSLDYSEKLVLNGKEHRGVGSELTGLKEEIFSYFGDGFKEADEYAKARLMLPAFWFASKTVLEYHHPIFEMAKMPKDAEEMEKLFERYKSEFGKHKDYLVANLEYLAKKGENGNNTKE
jgi:hypothetical protein